MGVSGVPEVVNGANVGFTDFSEFAVAAGLPSGITEFGIGNDSPTAVAIVNDPVEGNYFEMTGHGEDAWGFGLDAFDSEMEFGEILVRVFCNVSDGRRIIGGASSMRGLVGADPGPADFGFETSGAMRRLDSGDPDGITTATQVEDGSGGEIIGVLMQEAFQNGVWMWNRCRRVINPDVHVDHDDWQVTAWYGEFEDEPALDATSIDRTRIVDGLAAVGWAITANGTTADQRIAFLSYTSDPDLAAPPEPGALQELSDTVRPMRVSDLWSAGALRDKSPSGLIQTRSTKAAGWMFTMTYPLLSVRNFDHQELTTFLYTAWQRGQLFLARHPLQPGSGLRPNGLGTATVVIDGAAQAVGSDSINTDGWPNSTSNVARAGDAIKIDKDDGVYIVTASASSSAAGEATLEITPPLRKVPADNAPVETTDIFFRVAISDRSSLEVSRHPQSADGPAITLLEALD